VLKAVVLAGGSGSRLWPLSRQQLPKQFLKLEGEVSLLEATIQRLHPMIENSDVWVVTGEKHAAGEAYADLVKYNQILEPVGRNTAPAIALAAALLMDQSGGDPVMVVLPADHIIKRPDVFRAHLAEVVKVAESGRLVTFGIKPERPDTGFGYIEVEDSATEVKPVKRFTEKPDLATAEGFLQQGNYYWNSGMFVWKASVILEEISRWIPEIDTVLKEMRSAWQGDKPWQDVVRENFARLPDISIDYGVLERSSKVSLIPCDIDWSDVGSWDAVHEISRQDAQGNVLDGDVIAIDCKNTLLRSKDRLLAAVGLEDVIVVETADAILLAKRGDSQRVREIVDKLKERGSREHIEHLTVRRPWGSYKVLEDSGSGYKMKRIEVLPGHSLSLQSHQHRSEHWVVVSGTATVTRGSETFTVSKNESTYIPIGVLHRLENKGRIALQIVEVQVGEYVGEDDIERYDDSYGRME